MASVAPLRMAPRPRRFDVGATIYVALGCLGWASTTLLTSAGLFVLLFAMAGNFTLAGFFQQAGLLADHYLAADPARRAAFDGQAVIFEGVVLTCTGFFRRAGLRAVLMSGVYHG